MKLVTVLRLGCLLSFISLLFQRCGVDKPPAIAHYDDQLPQQVDYNLHVKPILSDKCFLCHGPDVKSRKAGLDLATPEGAYAALKETKGGHAIVPGDLADSEIYHRLLTTDAERMMPPPSSNRILTDYEKALLFRWIEQGAEYKPHWALIKPRKTEPPTVKNTAWPKNDLDRFILQKLEEKGLSPAPEADRETLIRRVTLDLTGLPPTLAEIDAFLTDKSPNAYEKLVDRLLKSPHYGEKMAVDWLDLARFADTHGYTVDRYRAVWPYRDWVIKAFNRNLPFDQFVTWQLAGDLLPKPNKEQRLATAFNRLHAQNMEGGIVNEEFRVEYVADRTNTLGTAFLGLTMECARCHDHKFDPISQKDYFSLFSFFNNVDEAGQISWDDAPPVPTMLLTEARHDSLLAFLDKQMKTSETDLSKVVQSEKKPFDQWRNQTKNTVTFDPKKDLQAHFSFDRLVNGQFVNAVRSAARSAVGKGTVAEPVLVAGKSGQAFRSNGDDILKLGPVGIFNRSQPFSVGAWVNIPAELNKGVIFHKGQGDILYNFRGYFLSLREGRAELLMAHTWPYNNIVRVTRQKLPKKTWIHLLMTYDGSSRADGLKLYVDGREAPLLTEKDNLYKDIIWEKGKSLDGQQPGLQVGADMRGAGFKNGLVDELVVYTRELTAPEARLLVESTGSYAPKSAVFSENNALFSYYLANVSTAFQRQRASLQSLRAERSRVVEAIPELMVMEEMKKPRQTYILKRGVYDAPGQPVQPDVPASILPFDKTWPRNRLGLARWLLHPDHPLTARVAVNRFWQTYFGMGLLKSADNFGNQGGLPSHPELLDWLAVQFREGDPQTGVRPWDIRAIQKLLVLSATYRQSSKATPEGLKNDPENVWLARGPAFRLTAEMVRDHALASSGLLTPTLGGPSVKPYQPDGLWAVNNAVYEPDTGRNLYRRSLYTFWRRTNPPPSMNTFDAPSRSYCVVQRQKTSTPLQALVLLNDPQFVEAARVLAEQVCAQSVNPADCIRHAYRLLTGRRPSAKEIAILTKLYDRQYTLFRQSPKKAEGWLKTGQRRAKTGVDRAALAAHTVVASTIMNSEDFIVKR